MEKQKVYQDELEAKPSEFIHKIAEKYQLQALAQGEIEFRVRGVGLPYEINCDKLTDDKIYELIIRNHLVAMVYLRREEANFTEANYVVFESEIKKLKAKWTFSLL